MSKQFSFRGCFRDLTSVTEDEAEMSSNIPNRAVGDVLTKLISERLAISDSGSYIPGMER